MPRILVVSTSFPQSGDGSEAAGSFVLDFADELAKGCEVRVVAPALEEGAQRLNDRLAVVRFAAPKLPLSLLNPLLPADWLRISRTMRNARRCLEEVAAESRPDHIFALWALPSGYWAQRIGKKYRVPYSTWALGSDIWSLGRIPVVRRFLRSALRHSVVNFADGFELADAVTKLSGKACEFLPSTRQLDTGKPVPLAEKPPYTLCFLGRWHPNKGIDILLDSLEQLTADQWSRIKTVRVAGGGPLEAMVKARCSKLQNDGLPVEIGGFLDKAQAVRWIQSADALMIPSRIESIPVIFSDAMKCGRPVISSPVGDLPRLLQQYAAGVLAEDTSAPSFAAAIGRMLEEGPRSYESGVRDAHEAFRLDHCVAAFRAAVAI